MNYLPIENFLIKAILVLVFLTLLTPLLVSTSTLFPYVFLKAIVFQLLVEAMIGCYVWLLYISYKKTGTMSNYLPATNILFWTLISFFIVLILSAIFGADPVYSFWSKQERMDGIFNLAHFFAFFFILAGVIKSGKSWLKILDSSIITSFVVSLYAIGQRFGWFFNPYGDRLTGTLGNAAFLAGYLLINIFFAIILFSQRKNIYLKIWYILIAFLELIILILTQTRGAMLALIASLLFFGIGYYFFSSPSPRKKYALILSLIIIFSSLTLFLARNSNFVKNQPLLNRFANISLQKDTGRIRIMSWKIGLQAFLEKPLFGWGQENYYVAFYKHLNPDFFTYSGETFDRAHNKIIDVLVMNGLLGLLSYLSIFGAGFFVLWRKRKQDPFIIFVLTSLLAAFFIQNLTLFDMPVSYLMFFLILSLIYFIAKPDVILQTEIKKNKQQSPVLFLTSAWITTFLLIYCAWAGNLKIAIASARSIDAQKILSVQPINDSLLKSSLEKFKLSVSSKTMTNPETGKILPPIFISASNSNLVFPSSRIESIKIIAQELEDEIKKMPLFADYYLNLADIYATLGAIDPSYFQKGKEAMEKLLKEYPNVPQFYYKMVINRLLAQDLNGARDFCLKSISLNEKLPTNWWYLSVIYYYAGDYQTAQENAEKAIKLGYVYTDFNGQFFLGQLNEKLRNFEKSNSFYFEALKLAPQDLQVNLNIAKNYKELGQKEKALELAQKLLASSTPQTAPTIKEFIDSLK